MARKDTISRKLGREPSGRLSRLHDEIDPTPTGVKRLRDAALAGVAREEWGSELGRLLLGGKIGPELYAAGRRWSECATRYRAAVGAPRPYPRAVPLEPVTMEAPPDPASEAGQRQATRDLGAMDALFEARGALLAAGPRAERVVRSVCEHDQAPCGARESEALRRGLECLARFWRMAAPT